MVILSIPRSARSIYWRDAHKNWVSMYVSVGVNTCTCLWISVRLYYIIKKNIMNNPCGIKRGRNTKFYQGHGPWRHICNTRIQAGSHHNERLLISIMLRSLFFRMIMLRSWDPHLVGKKYFYENFQSLQSVQNIIAVLIPIMLKQ